MRHLQRPSTTCNGELLTTFIAGDKSSPQFSLSGYYYMHASQVCSRHSFGLLLIRMNGIHRKQCDHSHLDHLWSLRIWSRAFGTSIKWNLCEAQRWSNGVFIFHRCRPHSVTFGFLLFSIIYWSLSHSIVIFTIIKNKSPSWGEKDI